MTPCYTCAKIIINSGIKKVVCEQDYHAGARSKEVFTEACIQYELLNNVMTEYADQGGEDKK
jgi:deoxycytidylate deaminase